MIPNNSHPSKLDFQETPVTGFLRSVASHPHNNALFVNNRYYTYQQLWQIVIRIHQQIPPEKILQHIGIYCSEDVTTYAAILAVNLYGAAYIPLNNKFPVSRNKNMIEQCQLKLILTSVENPHLRESAGGIDIVLTGDSDTPNSQLDKIDLESADAASRILIQQNNYRKVNQPIAYILFTSGSTGEPKGVPVSHINVNHFFYFFTENYDFNSDDKFLQAFELTFDLSVFSFFMPLMVGACCYVLPSDGIKFMKTIEYLQKYNITVLSVVPTFLNYIENYLSEISLPDLRYSFFMGDALYHQLAVKWSQSIPNAEIHNFYGPTETTIDCTRYIFDEKKSAVESVNGIVPLGKVFEEMEVLIVGENNIPIDKGELCLSGKQVIKAYLNNRNEDKFFVHQNKRYYKTGDIVSINAFGNLIFYGRTDSQVKINGYRIELAEIENAVSSIVNAKCVAVCKMGANNMNKIVVFIEKKQIDEDQLKEILCGVLPDYMIPQKFITTEKFVLNINEKVDKQNLLNNN